LAKVDEHLHQAKRNFKFLEGVNDKVNDSVDWQVTVCFYTALHLVNAHLAQSNLQYRTHNQVKHAINPVLVASPSRLPEDPYTAYITLQMLSRRSRYLVNEKDGQLISPNAAFTYDKHLGKAIRHLDKLVSYYCKTYKVEIPKIKIKCIELKETDNLQNITLVR
jgi:hypothetical protein